MISYHDTISDRAKEADGSLKRQALRFLNIIGLRLGPPPGKACNVNAWRNVKSEQCTLFTNALGMLGTLSELDFSCLAQIGGRDEVLGMMTNWIPQKNRGNIVKLRLSVAGHANVSVVRHNNVIFFC